MEQEGLRRWLARSETDAAAGARVLRQAELDRTRREQFVALVQGCVERLKALYASGKTEEDMRRSKQEILAGLKQDYQALKASWDGYSGYDAWFGSDINNAQLNTVSTYFDWVPAFNVILREQNNDLLAFYAKVSALSKLDEAERHAVLQAKLP